MSLEVAGTVVPSAFVVELYEQNPERDIKRYLRLAHPFFPLRETWYVVFDDGWHLTTDAMADELEAVYQSRQKESLQ